MGLDPLFPRREAKTHCGAGRFRPRVKTTEEEGNAQKTTEQPRKVARNLSSSHLHNN